MSWALASFVLLAVAVAAGLAWYERERPPSRVLALVAVSRAVPETAVAPGAGARQELGALRRPQVWLTLLVGAAGFGGFFAVYSYISPTLTEVSGFSESGVPVALALFGIGMTVGTELGGRLADWSVVRTIFLGLASTAVSLALGRVDADTIETELLYADLEQAERRLERVSKQAKSLDRALVAEEGWLRELIAGLQEGRPAREFPPPADAPNAVRELQPITAKPVLYVANVGEDADVPPTWPVWPWKKIRKKSPCAATSG